MIREVLCQIPSDRGTEIVLEYLLLGDIRELLQEKPSARTRRALLVLLDAVLDELSMFALDGDGLEDVLDDCPQWYREIEIVRGDHLSHYLRLVELRESIEANVNFDETADKVRTRLNVMFHALQNMRCRETRLIQLAVNEDVGGEA